MASDRVRAAADGSREYAIGIARAFGGAILFALPLLMTMEMWWLGLYLERDRLLLFVVLDLALLVGLSHYTGFEPTERLRDDVIDALTAFGVGAIASAAVLAIFGLIGPGITLDELIGKVAVQAVPAGIGAAVARKQLAPRDGEQEEREERAGYVGQLFLMLAGALFFSFNMAPTEEMALLAFRMTPWHGIALAVLSMLLLHAFVYRVGFAGQERQPEGARFVHLFVHYTLAGYALALVASFYVLWTFGRMEDVGFAFIAMMTVVLGFPAALGAAVARLIV